MSTESKRNKHNWTSVWNIWKWNLSELTKYAKYINKLISVMVYGESGGWAKQTACQYDIFENWKKCPTANFVINVVVRFNFVQGTFFIFHFIRSTLGRNQQRAVKLISKYPIYTFLKLMYFCQVVDVSTWYDVELSIVHGAKSIWAGMWDIV